ncbi:MAG: aromatic amino acid lyase, partial [Actinobacteria bacterium]|nr:aromatic amino acid lyase [Actinomycetota bacterium]
MKMLVGATPLRLEALHALGDASTTLELSAESWDKVRRAREVADEQLASGKAVYGLTVGLGSNVDTPIERADVADFERSTLAGRIVGVGGPLDESTSRRALGLRIVNLAHGASGVSAHVVEHLLAMYNARVTPVISRVGSVGSSDLPECAEMCATALGIGRVWIDGEIVDATVGLEHLGRRPVELAAKDALGLFNAGSVTLSRAVGVAHALSIAVRAGVVVAAASCEAFGVNPSPFTRGVVEMRGDAREDAASRELLEALAGSWICEPDAVKLPQHALSFRTLVKVVALVRDQLDRLVAAVELEANTPTDNPVVLTSSREMISGAHFQTLGATVAGDALSIALAHWSNASTNRAIKLVNAPIDGVPRFLAPGGGHNVGFNALMKTAVSLHARIRYDANPASLDFIAVSQGTEDVASQWPHVIDKLERQADVFTMLVALEAL